LTGEPSWSHRIDRGNWNLRSLLPATATLPSTEPGPTFRLQDVFTYGKPIKIDDGDARGILMLYVLANAYLEGLLPATHTSASTRAARRVRSANNCRATLTRPPVSFTATTAKTS
jgi:hypothetical protein